MEMYSLIGTNQFPTVAAEMNQFSIVSPGLSNQMIFTMEAK